MANRAIARMPPVRARCSACGEYREFKTDRNGRILEQCGCGYRTYVEWHSGKDDEPPKRSGR